MTVDSRYFIEQFVNDGEVRYTFKYENIGTEPIKVYSVLTSDTTQRTLLVFQTDYVLELEKAEFPTFKGGTIVLTTPVASGSFLQVERKTPIATDYLAEAGQPFESLQYEFAMDRVCFIQQEIEGSACDCRVPAIAPPPPSPIWPSEDIVFCKQYECNALSTAILAASPDSYYPCNNGWDGLNVPGPTLGVGDLLFDTVGTKDLVSAGGGLDIVGGIYDGCVDTTALHSGAGATFRLDQATTYQYLTGGTMMYVERDDSGDSGGALDVRFLGSASSPWIVLNGGISSSNFTCTTTTDEFVGVLPNRSPVTSGIIIIRWIDTGTTVTYKVQTDAGIEFEGVLTGTLANDLGAFYSELTWFQCSQTDAVFWDRPISDVDMDSIIAAYSQNFTGYTDPNPDCVPP